MTTNSFHRANFGAFARALRADMDGYVHLTTEAVLNGNWDTAGEDMTEEQAEEIASHNRRATKEAEEALAEWRGENN